MVSKALLAALALTAFLAMVPLSAADCIDSCSSVAEDCITNCGEDVDCAITCSKTGVRCVCGCVSSSTRKMADSSSAAKRTKAILSFTRTIKQETAHDTAYMACIGTASENSSSCVANCKTGDMLCLRQCTDMYFDQLCPCANSAASLQAGILVALAALLSRFAHH